MGAGTACRRSRLAGASAWGGFFLLLVRIRRAGRYRTARQRERISRWLIFGARLSTRQECVKANRPAECGVSQWFGPFRVNCCSGRHHRIARPVSDADQYGGQYDDTMDRVSQTSGGPLKIVLVFFETITTYWHLAKGRSHATPKLLLLADVGPTFCLSVVHLNLSRRRPA